MKCVLTDVSSESSCAWCNKKTDCVEASIEATFFKKNLLCWKCLRKAIEMRCRHEHQQQVVEPKPKPASEKALPT
jgi:hypothetical protein